MDLFPIDHVNGKNAGYGGMTLDEADRLCKCSGIVVVIVSIGGIGGIDVHVACYIFAN